MSAFASRTLGYKAGVFLLFFATCIYLIGFGSPYWIKMSLNNSVGLYTYNEGLWMLCATVTVDISSVSSCASYGVIGFAVWFHAVRALTCACCVGLVIACIVALAQNCCRTIPGPRSRVLEILTCVLGLLGFGGCILYVVFRKIPPDSDDFSSQVLFALFSKGTYNWSFYLATIGSGLSFIAGIVIAVTNKPVEGPTHTSGMVMSTVQQRPPNAPQPYYYPPQAGYGAGKPGYPAPY